MGRSYWMTLLACGCLCVAAVYQNARISELEGQVGTGESGLADARLGLALEGGTDSTTSAELLGRLHTLERRVQMIQRELALGAVTEGGGVQGAMEPWEAEGQVDREGQEDEQTSQTLEGILDGEGIESEETRGKLRDFIREEQRAAFQEHREERWKRRQERQDAELRSFADRVDLSDSQFEEMMSFVNEERGQIRGLFDAARAGELDYHDARDSARSLRDQTQERLKDVLDDEQFVAYTEFREEERNRRRRF